MTILPQSSISASVSTLSAIINTTMSEVLIQVFPGHLQDSSSEDID